MVIPTSQWEVTIEFQVCILAFATIHHKQRCQSRFRWTLSLRLSFDASTPHLWRWMHAMLCNGQWQEKRNRQGETGETLKILEDREKNLSRSGSWEKIKDDIWGFETSSRDFVGWINLLKGQLLRVQDQAACCLPTPQWAFWTQASADEVLYIPKDLRRKCIKLYMSNRHKSHWTDDLTDPFIFVC